MKRYAVLFALLLCCAVGAAVWFCPLSSLGEVTGYENNVATGVYEGLYPPSSDVRTEGAGSEEDMLAALKSMRAEPVERRESGGTVIVYALSPRVPCRLTLPGGAAYNVMAACRDGVYYIGTPVLEGSY